MQGMLVLEPSDESRPLPPGLRAKCFNSQLEEL